LHLFLLFISEFNVYQTKICDGDELQQWVTLSFRTVEAFILFVYNPSLI